MRIIHDIHDAETLQAALSGDLYYPSTSNKDKFPGWRCEILITTKDPLSGKTEPIYIEGKASDIRCVLTRILNMLDSEDRFKHKEWDAKQKATSLSARETRGKE